MSDVEKAVSCFKEGFMCSQAVLTAYAQQFGLDRDAALKVSAAFGGGMGRMGETCGAVTGAFMVIGLKYGRTAVKDTQAHEKTNKLVKKFVDQFKSINGSIMCRELLSCDLSTPEGLKIFADNKLRDSLCTKFVRDAAEIVEQLLK
ncbi:MAG: C_GCAxxG_C_C family protein [Chloroflexota bacterium]|nr:MAG: C_GCAxxG_C_C family protein [Chloroflexota bacterium]